jgi:uncharacterized protein YhaN
VRITDIRIDGFGVWNTISVDELSPGITLFYGPNEAGKTTLMQFTRAVLYGFSAERRRLYLPPVFGGVPGGMLRVENHNGGFIIERRESEKAPDGDGRLIVTADNGSRQGQHLLNVLVSGIDESIFNNVFAVGIRELQELATLNDTQAAEQLYNMASGVDRVSLVDVMRRLRSSCHGIWSPEQPADWSKLAKQRNTLQTEIHTLQRQTDRWGDLATQRRALIEEISQFEQRILQAEGDARTVEIADQVREPWEKRQEVEQQLEAIGSPEELPEGCISQIDEINLQIEQQREMLLPQKKRRRAIRRDLASQPINRALWDQSCRIEAVCEHGPWIASLDEEIRRLREEVARSEDEMLKHEDSASTQAIPNSGSTVVSSQLLQQIHPAAQGLREAVRKRSIARKVQKKSRQDVDEASADLKDELGRSVENFDELLEETAGLAKTLQRRTKIGSRLEAMQRERVEFDEEYQEIVDDQLQNVRVMAAIGGLFIFGFVLALTGMFGWKIMPMSLELCWGTAILGGVCVALSVMWKVVLERTAQEELDDCLERHDRIDDEIEAIVRDRNELDALLPEGRGTLASRLASAEKELKELEEMAPLQQERQQALKRKHHTGRHASGADDELRDARRRWKRALRDAGLPGTLTPKHVRQLGVHQQKRSDIEGLLEQQLARIEKLSGERAALVQRLTSISSDIGLNSASSDPQIQLSQLATALAGQREMVRARRELQKEEKLLKRGLSRGLQKLRRLDRARESIFAEARVTDEAELRNRAAAIEEQTQLDEQHRLLAAQIRRLIGEHCSEEDVGEEIQESSQEELKRRARTLAASLRDYQTHLAQLHQRHGEINQEMKSLAEDRRLAAARFELGCVETKLAAAIEKYRTSAATLRLLEDIRETYEVERQPETLGEASLFLERLTAGKYSRIWTPLGKNELRVDDQDGQPVPLDVLSRGTREAVFLSLRLALVAAYGRRGVNVPMILDDVLVNLDRARAEAAVEILCDFANEGRQLLFFTCHQHMKEMFVAASVDTRVLPAHRTPGVHVAPLLEQHPLVTAPEEEPESVEEEIAEEPAEVEPAEVEAVEEIVPEEIEEEPQVEIEVLSVAMPLDQETIVEVPDPVEEEVEEEPVVSELDDSEAFDDDFWWWSRSADLAVPAGLKSRERD